MKTNRSFWINAAFLVLGMTCMIQSYRLDALQARVAALETAQKTARGGVTIQTLSVHVEKAQDAPQVAVGLLRHVLPGFANVKRLTRAEDLTQ